MWKWRFKGKSAATCIWCSPTYNAEHFQQFNRRIYRAGQTKKTETILISAKDTWEEEVYVKLNTKLGRMENLLHILSELNNGQQQNDISWASKPRTNGKAIYIALENEDANLPERFEELMTEASRHAIDLADGVHIFIKPTKEVLH